MTNQTPSPDLAGDNAGLAKECLAMKARLAPLTLQSEDRVWRPAQAACDLLDKIAALRPTQADNVLREAKAFADERIAELSAIASEKSPDRQMRQFALGAVVAFSDDMLAALKAPTTEPNPVGAIAQDYLAAKDDARRLAVALWEKHFRERAPDWKPLTDLRGIISQIDNMTAAMAPTPEQSQ